MTFIRLYPLTWQFCVRLNQTLNQQSAYIFSTWSISLLIGMAMTEGGGQNGDNMVIWGWGCRE